MNCLAERGAVRVVVENDRSAGGLLEQIGERVVAELEIAREGDAPSVRGERAGNSDADRLRMRLRQLSVEEFLKCFGEVAGKPVPRVPTDAKGVSARVLALRGHSEWTFPRHRTRRCLCPLSRSWGGRAHVAGLGINRACQKNASNGPP